jgi:hypothetical protein
MYAQVLEIFLGKEHLVKNWLISTLGKVIYFKWTNFQRCTKPLFTSQNRVEISWKYFSHFFEHASFTVAPKISMGRALLHFLVYPCYLILSGRPRVAGSLSCSAGCPADSTPARPPPPASDQSQWARTLGGHEVPFVLQVGTFQRPWWV